MKSKFNLIKKVSFIFLVVIALSGILFSNNINSASADSAIEYLKKGDGTYLTYSGSSEKVLTLKEYNNPIQQYRAVWVSHFAGDVHAYSNEASYKAELTTILDNMDAWGMNALVFHIRTHNNAMYKSELNPRARWWSKVDFDTFDPLEWLINECHSRGIEFHAWMNPYRVLDSNIVGTYPEGNPALDPNLLLSSSSGTILNPGSQVVRDFIVDTCMEVIEQYDVDAIHFDDYFYIKGVETDKSADWKRQQVDLFIEQLHNEMTAHNEKYGKNVQLGISPSGIYRNGSYASKPSYDSNGNLSSPLYSNTSGFAHYGDYLYSDTLNWINNEWIDYITPQTYWGIENTAAGYDELTRWWDWAVAYKDVNLYMGMGIYMAIENSGAWRKDVNEARKQLLLAGNHKNIDGICVYKYSSLLDSDNIVQNGVSTFKEFWGNKKVPSAVQKSYADKLPSYPVTNLCVSGNSIIWDAVENVRGYMVYKVPTGETLDKTNLDHLVKYTQSTSITVNDTAVYDYYVATVNKANVIGDTVKLSVGSSLEPHEVVISRIDLLPANITSQHETEVNNVATLYNNLTSDQKALVTNYSKLQSALKVISDINVLEGKMNTYINSLSKDLENGKPLIAPTNMRWSYKNASDATAYNIQTGEIHGTYLARKVVLTLTGTVENSTEIKTVDYEFNISVISSKFTSVIYRDDASCMTPNDIGAYTPEDAKYIGWSNRILFVGSYALPIAVGNYQEITDVNALSQVHWTSCGGVFKNATEGTIQVVPNNLFATEYANAGYIIITADNKVKESANALNYSSSVTLETGEVLYVVRYLDVIAKGSPFKTVADFAAGTYAEVVSCEEKEQNSAVESVILVISQLPEVITLDDENVVNEALAFYNTLSVEEKAQVTNYAKLEAAVNALNTLVEEREKLNAKKEEAKTIIEIYATLENYSTVNQSSIKGYIDMYKKELETATTIAEVEDIVRRYKASVDGIQTIAEELVSKKAIAKTEIKNYVSLDNYSETKQKEIQAILATADARIDATTSFDELNAVISELQTELSNVLNLEEELTYLKFILITMNKIIYQTMALR